MFFNSMRKPRGFNHQYIYVNERKEKLDKMEEKAKRELGILPVKLFSPVDIRCNFVVGTTYLKRRNASGRKPVSFGIILIIIAFLLYLWHYLATGSWSF